MAAPPSADPRPSFGVVGVPLRHTSHAKSPSYDVTRSGREVFTRRVMPSRQVTDEWKPRSLSLPTSRMSGGTDASVNSKLTGLSMSSPISPHHSSTLTTSSPPQLTTFAGVDADASR